MQCSMNGVTGHFSVITIFQALVMLVLPIEMVNIEDKKVIVHYVSNNWCYCSCLIVYTV